MRRLLTTLACLATLALTPSASAGGWATVQLSSTPDGVRSGAAWRVDLTVLRHGRTPLAGVAPVVRISRLSSKRSFAAQPTGRRGVYHADVVFPAAGTWRWEIWDGFSRTHTYAPVTIGAKKAARGEAG